MDDLAPLHIDPGEVHDGSGFVHMVEGEQDNQKRTYSYVRF